jgi:phage gp29-like protein
MADQRNYQQWLTAINPFGRTKTDPQAIQRDLRNYIAPVQLQRLRQDIQSWRDVLTEAENVWFPHRVKAQRLYIDTINNGHVFACMERRKDLTLLRKWEFVDAKGKTDQKTTDLFLETVKGQSQNKEWFNRFLNFSLDSIFFGYTLVALGDIVNDEFPGLDIIKRWNISPDRLNVTNFTYSISGALFLEEPYKNWHVYIKTYNDIGTSKSGYGLLYKIALYEIFLRNILGFNGDFVELYSQPYRVGKTTKTNDTERAQLEAALQQMGSSGYALLDPEDEITFLETALGGTGYQGYTDFEKRIEAKISKIILGHADALDSIPGKLGNSKEKSPAEVSMKDKQTRDGSFISNVINNGLLVNMRALGFAIPEETKAVLKNDAEIIEMNNTIIAQAVEIKKAGLQVDEAYFTKQTGIPVAAPPEPVKAPLPIQPLPEKIKDKLQKIYNHANHQS